MKGFKQWYERIVKTEYADRSYRDLKEAYYSEWINTGSIEIPARMTKSGHVEVFR